LCENSKNTTEPDVVKEKAVEYAHILTCAAAVRIFSNPIQRVAGMQQAQRFDVTSVAIAVTPEE
jgi:hypothetical protein